MDRQLKVCLYGAAILRKRVRPVKVVDVEAREIFRQMAGIMHKSEGVGLAANQVGLDMQMLVIDIGAGVIKMANPCIVRKRGKVVAEEGCLSLPNTRIKVRRAKEITVVGLDEHNQNIKMEARDLLARVFQHEVDHLNGRLIVDYLPWYKRVVGGVRR
ncbi:MAG: peptide deformylase [Candidatus Omnitrophota bacterium]